MIGRIEERRLGVVPTMVNCNYSRKEIGLTGPQGDGIGRGEYWFCKMDKKDIGDVDMPISVYPATLWRVCSALI